MIRPAAALILMAPASVGAFSLSMPVDCTLAAGCFIQNYPDRDPGPDAQDFACGGLSYDGHSGTDFALPTLRDMRQGVTVMAAAPGRVTAVRDGMADVAQGTDGAPDVAGRDCGNGVVIAHDDGWETQYCHMARGSVRVRTGDRVEAGSPLGKIGLSGRTEFPHLHLSVRRNGQDIDPFDPDGAAGCGPGPAPALWSSSVAYVPGGLIGMGLASDLPSWAALKEGLPMPPLANDAPALVLWARYFGNRAGDILRLSITGPDGGSIIAEDVRLDRTQAQGFRAIGRRLRGTAWPPGDYRIEAVLIRDGAEIDRRIDTVPLP